MEIPIDVPLMLSLLIGIEIGVLFCIINDTKQRKVTKENK